MSTTPHTPAMRIKSHWFRSGASRGAAEQASAMAFIVWRVAQQMLKRMRGADFDIDAGPPYFAFMREVLVFLIAVSDRIAYTQLTPEARSEFTVALVRHLARTLQDNEQDLLGPVAAGAPPYADTFIDLVNDVTSHYAEFGADPMTAQSSALPSRASLPPVGEADAATPRPGGHRGGGAGFEPDFAFVRYLGSRLEPTLPEKDRRWVIEQVMASEAPEALAIVQRSMRDLFDATPRKPRRSVVSGD